MSLESLNKKLEECDGLNPLDLSVEEERQYYLESLGGEENLKKNFPVMYASYRKSLEGAKNRLRVEKEQDDVHFNVYDVMSVAAGVNAADKPEKDFLAASIEGSFLDKNAVLTEAAPAECFNVLISGKIYDPDSPRMPYVEIHDSFCQVNKIDRQYLSRELYSKEEFWNRELKAKFTVTVYDSQNSMKTFTYSKTSNFGNPLSYAIENIRFDAPVSTHPETKEIRILYGRSAQNLDNPDYIYKSNNADANQGKLWTIVPISGEVTLKKILNKNDYYSFAQLSKPDPDEVMERSTLQYDNMEWRIYRYDLKDEELYKTLNDGSHFKVTVGKDHAEVLRFDLFNPDWKEGEDRRYDWVHDIDKASTDNRQRTCYLLGGFTYDICKKNEKGEVIEPAMEYQIICRSVDPENLPSGRQYYTYEANSGTIYIPPIRLWWGCHAKEALIQMCNGSCRRADEIQIGDQVIGYKGKQLTVNNIYCGHEQELICVQTDDGCRLRVSKGHPLLREDEMGTDAASLLPGDRILSGKGVPVEVISVETVPYDDQVYNFTFEGEKKGNYIIADGLCSGDFYAQNKRSGRKPALTEQQKALTEELAAFCEMGKKPRKNAAR